VNEGAAGVDEVLPNDGAAGAVPNAGVDVDAAGVLPNAGVALEPKAGAGAAGVGGDTVLL
jgi:hypothetical protein